MSEEKTETKKQKTTNIEEADDKDWPEAWYMVDDEQCKDQKAENRQTPNKPANVSDLRKIGIQYWKMDADAYEYPVKAVPWDPQDATDPKLAALRDDREFDLILFRLRMNDIYTHHSLLIFNTIRSFVRSFRPVASTHSFMHSFTYQAVIRMQISFRSVRTCCLGTTRRSSRSLRNTSTTRKRSGTSWTDPVSSTFVTLKTSGSGSISRRVTS